MTFEEKTKEYRDQITSLKEIDSLEVYQWLISLGKKLNENPLSKEKQTQENKVVRCPYDLYVDKEDDTSPRHGATQWWQVVMRMYLSIFSIQSAKKKQKI